MSIYGYDTPPSPRSFECVLLHCEPCDLLIHALPYLEGPQCRCDMCGGKTAVVEHHWHKMAAV